MADVLNEKDWGRLLQRIKNTRCTPFLGAGACHPSLPLGEQTAMAWAEAYSYPLLDCHDLARVSQFLAVAEEPLFPKEKLLNQFKYCEPPDFTDPDEPHRVLADLPFPIYLTTNYDDFMVKALKSQDRDPRREICRWNRAVQREPSYLEEGFEPTVANPIVFHLHGRDGLPQSLVLTEDDYMEFLVSISTDRDVIPPRIQRALTATSLLFIGYRLADWDLRVLLRGLVASVPRGLRFINLAVQLLPEGIAEEKRERAQTYLDEYFDKLFDVRIYWGTAREFAAELRGRWEAFDGS